MFIKTHYFKGRLLLWTEQKVLVFSLLLPLFYRLIDNCDMKMITDRRLYLVKHNYLCTDWSKPLIILYNIKVMLSFIRHIGQECISLINNGFAVNLKTTSSLFKKNFIHRSPKWFKLFLGLIFQFTYRELVFVGFCVLVAKK